MITSTLKLFEADKYSNGSPEMPSNHHPVNLTERLFGNKQVNTHLSLQSIAFAALARGRVVTSTYAILD